MKKVLVLYYSRSGNTEKMAKAVVEGAKSVAGIEVELNYHVAAANLLDYDAILMGAPTYHNVIPIDFKNLIAEAAALDKSLKGKIGAAFGSYGWSGEAPQLVLDLLKEKLNMEIVHPPVLAKYAPDQTALEECKNLGKQIAEKLSKQS